ncbi:hypothetical protein ASPWEDRAFT_61221 [Aspergillus wentii DTO 134E9]|uniref:Nudix hydrolase domain-containing protein n=1 Tax=Aspergillus wentii DTO 134E9 TaxID=1073089 RepID=A0A1L9RDW0_ASPWE|nr:uncharacterized protein ASPWEDRAFT_61221 [Aspergillus wentii DTO 134E9]OJJ33057.1 hypothetical protein ASPWEDRAFT_61221 [Aspergillus wentii DTO 134E9]
MSQPSAKLDNLSPYPEPRLTFSSIILVSPRNEILLRGGGDLSSQDGPDPKRHDAIWYRRAALRELFEGSGILLARDTASGAMLHVSDAKRGEGRRAIHAQKTTFAQWLKKQDSAAEPDTENLIPFTRWVNPIGVPYRYTTQMYLYFLPMDNHDLKRDILNMPREIHELTHDGGIEITDARFLESSEWLRKAVKKEVKLLPPQYFLRRKLAIFAHSGSPPWTQMCISPTILRTLPDGRSLVGLDTPGHELEGSDRRGVGDRVVLVRIQ